jgi:hypothetical protein
VKRSFLSFVLLSWSAAFVTAELPTWESLIDKARWAQNAHNVQSWKLETMPGRPDTRRLVLESTRLLPQTDAPQRQLTVSLGCFLAVLEDAAAAQGARVTWQPLTDVPGALVTLSEDPAPSTPAPNLDALAAPTVKYRTAAFSLPARVLRDLEERYSTPTVRFHWITEPADVAAAKAWARDAFNTEMDLPRTRDESIAYTRVGETARRLTPWGITLLPNFPRGELFWVEAFEGLFPESPAAYARDSETMLGKALGPVEQILVVTSRGNGNLERLRTGEALQRVWMRVIDRGGRLLPLSQGLEEFPEMAPRFDEAARRWARDGETVQMVLALFKPGLGEFLRSPRLPAASIISQ